MGITNVGYYLSISFDNYNWGDVFFLLNFYLKFRSYLPPLFTRDVLDQLNRDRIICDLMYFKFFPCRAFLSRVVEQTRARRALLWRIRWFCQEETDNLVTYFFIIFCTGGTRGRTCYGLLWQENLGKTFCSPQHLLHPAWSINKLSYPKSRNTETDIPLTFAEFNTHS